MQKYSHISQSDYETVAGPDWPSFAQFQLHADVPDFVYKEIDDMIRPPEGFSHDSFCVLPFYAMEYPLKTPCCLLPGATNIDSVKSSMLQGQRPAACKKCWNLEDSGIKSDRQLKNETLDFYTNIDLEQLIEECRQEKNKTIHYKIDTSNTCNAACTTCNGKFSSTWNRLTKKHNLSMHTDWKISPDQTTDWVDYVHAKSISFRGGEPFLSDTNFYILEQLIQHNNTDCFVSFVTNGSFSLSKRQKEILLKFKNLNFCFSIDGIGPVFEYIRWPLKWSDIEDNIAWCRENNIHIGVNYTVSNMNLLYHAQTTMWFDNHKINYQTNPVYSPACFRPQSLPIDAKQKIFRQPGNETTAPWVTTHSSGDEKMFNTFQIEVAKQDGMKNIAIKDYLPELVALLKW